MNRYPLWRYLLIAVLLILGLIYALPNIYGDDPAIQISNQAGTPISNAVKQRILSLLESEKLPVREVEPEEHGLLIRFADTEDQLKAQDSVEHMLGQTYSVALNLAPRTPDWLIALGAEPMKLGLDLRGGIHFLMFVDVGAGVKARLQGDMQAVTTALRGARIRYKGISLAKETLRLRFKDETGAEKAKQLLVKQFSDYVFAITPDESQYILSIKMTQQASQKLSINAMDQSITILRNRVNALGVSEPIVQQQGRSYISVDLPGVQDSARAKQIIGTAATVRMQLVDTENNAVVAKQTGVVPFGSKLYEADGRPILLKNEVILSGTSIVSASASIGQNGQPAVNIRASGQEITRFHEVTGANIGKPMAVVYVETLTNVDKVDGKNVVTHRQVEKVINVATIQAALAGNFVISNMVSMQAAQNLALLLRSGAYPIPIDIVEEQVIGPSMGKENINKGEMSTGIGFALVVIFMLFYYRFFGFVADLALILNLVFIMAIMSLLHATLTLPGIAGIVLTIGMAVDANVLINERIREELRLGMSPQASINAGYGRAFSTIVDANVTTLIVAVILFGIGSGPVKNFAITLTIGLLTSMVSAIFFTRAVVNLFYGSRAHVDHLSIGIKVPPVGKRPL